MRNFRLKLTVIFASDCRLDNISKVRTRIQTLTASPFMLLAGEGTDGKETEDSYIFIQYTSHKADAEKLAELIQGEFKQECVLVELRTATAYLFSK